MSTHVIFERSTSTLYYSNDTKLHVVRDLLDPETYHVAVYANANATEGEIVFSTHQRVLADAYIAGYDLATSKEAAA